MDPLTRFSNRAADYAKYRPSYPRAAIDFILEGLTPADLIAADIGAGTGISSRLLADRGARVMAIEPNDSMRAAALAHPLVDFRAGSGEATGLPAGSIDVITCFQSFHWLRRADAYAEFRRIARGPRRVALAWNIHDVRDPLTAEYHRIMTSVSPEAASLQDRDADDPTLLPESLFSRRKLARLGYRQRLDRNEFIGRIRSSSYFPLEGPPYDRSMAEMLAAFARYADADDRVDLAYETFVHRAELN